MKKRILTAITLFASVLIPSQSFAVDRPPNVVFFLVDDLGQRDLGCYGSTFYETPNLDRLAKDGAKFTDAYAACPVCSPTRASILTGPVAAAHGHHRLHRRADEAGAVEAQHQARCPRLTPTVSRSTRRRSRRR